MASRHHMQNQTCEVCDARYSLESDYFAHLKSTKHNRKLKKVVNHYKTHGVYIRNISPTIMIADVLEHVCQFGTLDKCVFYKGCAQFLFKEKKSADIIKSTLHELGGQKIKIIPWRFCFVTNTQEREMKEDDILHNKIALALKSDLCFEEEVAILKDMIQVPDPTQKANIICQDLACILRPLFNEISVQPFGSAFTRLAVKGSDMDFNVDPTCSIQRFQEGTGDWSVKLSISQSDLNAATVIMENSNSFSEVKLVAEAKVPIIKFVHTLTGVKCDICFTGVAGIQNSRLIKYYMSLDPRVEKLLLITKHWNKYFRFKKCGLTSYGVVMMTLFYLMQLDCPIIPTVAYLKRKCPKRLFVDGWDCSLDLTKTLVNNNHLTLIELLYEFFNFYSHFDVGMSVICVLTGQEIPKVNFKHINLLPQEMLMYKKKMYDADQDFAGLKTESNFCVQDPFYLNYNITSRMETEEVFRLQTVCWSCANVIQAGQGLYSSTGILKRLFDRQIDFAWEWNHSFTHSVIWINVGTYVPAYKPELSAREMQAAWFVLVCDKTKQVFKKICHFEIIEAQAEVSGLSDIMSCSLLCSRENVNLRCNRKAMSNFLKNRYRHSKMSWFDFEVAVSNHLIREGGPVEAVKFVSVFHLHSNPTRIALELKKIDSSGTDFEEWAVFLNANLPTWLANAVAATKRGD